MKPFVLILLVLMLSACTNPVKVNNEIQVSGAALLYQADAYTKIKALSVAPHSGNIAFISQKPEYDLFRLSLRDSAAEQSISKNLYDIQLGGTLSLSASASRLAIVFPHKIIVREIAALRPRSYPFTDLRILQGMWGGSRQVFYLLTADSLSGRRQIIKLNLADGAIDVVFDTAGKPQRFAVNLAQNTFAFYEEPASGPQIVFFTAGQTRPDTVAVAYPVQHLAVAANGRQILWSAHSAGGVYEVFSYDMQSQQQERLLQLPQEILALKWSPDDAKVLLLHANGLDIFALHNYKMDASKVFTDSSKAIRFSPQWADDSNNIYFIKKTSANRLNLFAGEANNSFRSMRINISKDYIMDWSGDGRRVLLNEGQHVRIKDLENGNERLLKLPLPAITPVRWGGAQGQWLTYVSNAEDEKSLVLLNDKSGEVRQYACNEIDTLTDLAWLHGYEYVSFILPHKTYMLIFGLNSQELQKIKVAPGDIRKVCWAPEDAPLTLLNGDYAAVQGRKALGIYYFDTNYIYWLNHLTPVNAAYFAWKRDAKSLIYVTSEATGVQQVFMEQVIYLNN